MRTFSILDTDLYKFTTSYAYMMLYPNAECEFTFVDRNRVARTSEFLEEFKKEMKRICNIGLTDEEFAWVVPNIPFINQFYWEWLKTFRFDYDKLNIFLDKDNVLTVKVVDNNWKATLYEIPVLFSVPEVQNSFRDMTEDECYDVTYNTIKKTTFANDNGIAFSEFGTRRRYNYEVQELVIKALKENSKTCTGTSNVHFAMKYGMKPMGTHPHEWFMFHGAQFGYKHANYLALEAWTKVYDGNLGIALTDTYTSDVFFRNFSMKHAKLFDGIRQDSGDEYDFTEKAIKRYRELGINPLTKTIIFSNALNFPKAKEINDYCKDKIRCSFGIGTNLTNDTNYPSENIVMKMTKCRMNRNQPWEECIKLSDDIGKHLGSSEEVKAAMYDLKLNR